MQLGATRPCFAACSLDYFAGQAELRQFEQE